MCLAPLAFKFFSGFLRSPYAPHTAERVHVEGQVVEIAVGRYGYRAVGVAVERHQTVDKPPYFGIRSVEYVGTVAVHVYARDVFAVYVAARMVAAVDHQAFAPRVGSHSGECGAEKPGAHYQIIVVLCLMTHMMRCYCVVAASVVS